MIYVIHDQVEALTLASRIVVMRDGLIQQIGAPAEVYERPNNLFVGGFLGAPGLNFVSGQIHLREGAAPALLAALPLSLEDYVFKSAPQQGQPLVLGLRAEDIWPDLQGELSATVQLAEPMGNHQVVWLQVAGLSLAALVHDGCVLQIDETVRFSVKRSRVSLFDAAGELRLRGAPLCTSNPCAMSSSWAAARPAGLSSLLAALAGAGPAR